MIRKLLLTAMLSGFGLVAPLASASASAQTNATTDGASRAGSNAGSSPLTPTHAPAPKPRKPAKGAASHRLPASATGMGSQAANTTGPTSNSH